MAISVAWSLGRGGRSIKTLSEKLPTSASPVPASNQPSTAIRYVVPALTANAESPGNRPTPGDAGVNALMEPPV